MDFIKCPRFRKLTKRAKIKSTNYGKSQNYLWVFHYSVHIQLIYLTNDDNNCMIIIIVRKTSRDKRFKILHIIFSLQNNLNAPTPITQWIIIT